MASIEAAGNVAQYWKVPELKSYLQSRGITILQKKKEGTGRIGGEGSRSFTNTNNRWE